MVGLADVATGFHAWSEVHAPASLDVFTRQERISDSIAETLSGQTRNSSFGAGQEKETFNLSLRRSDALAR
jgi:hypothetical protein